VLCSAAQFDEVFTGKAC